MILTVLILAAGGTALYLWRFSVQHDIVRYVIGPVTGTSKISQQHFSNVVKGVVQDWNKSAGKTIIWGLPFGRVVQISLATDKAVKDYTTEIAYLEEEESTTYSAVSAVIAEWKDFETQHTVRSEDEDSPTYWRLLTNYTVADNKLQSIRRNLDSARAQDNQKDTHVTELQTISTSSPGQSASLTITVYANDADLRALLLHAVGHVLGLVHSSADDVMSATGRSTTITKALAAEAAAGH